jgi:hypothetical protein
VVDGLGAAIVRLLQDPKVSGAAPRPAAWLPTSAEVVAGSSAMVTRMLCELSGALGRSILAALQHQQHRQQQQSQASGTQLCDEEQQRGTTDEAEKEQSCQRASTVPSQQQNAGQWVHDWACTLQLVRLVAESLCLEVPLLQPQSTAPQGTQHSRLRVCWSR